MPLGGASPSVECGRQSLSNCWALCRSLLGEHPLNSSTVIHLDYNSQYSLLGVSPGLVTGRVSQDTSVRSGYDLIN